MVASYIELLDMSWVLHDSALEGVVYTKDELTAALKDDVISDTSLIPVYDEIRNHKRALEFVRTIVAKKRFQFSLDVAKELFAILAPEELDGKAPKYRKDMPLHRLYFHEISAPDKISYKMRQLVQWMTDPATKRSTHPVRLAARAHFQMIHIYPFQKHSGKVARLVMNLLLMRSGYPPAVIHQTQRQMYYDALKNSEDRVMVIINKALGASVESAIQFYEAGHREPQRT